MRTAAVAALAAVAAAVALLALDRGQDMRSVTAEFTDVRGLVAGAQVRLAGVPVGQVTRIWLARDGWPRVEMSIDSDISPGQAAVRMASLSGEFNRYVSIVQSSGRGRAYIPRSGTTSPVEVDQALSALNPSTERGLRTVLQGLRRALRGQGRALAAALRPTTAALEQAAELAGDIGDDGGALRLALGSSRIIARNLAAAGPYLGRAVDRTAALMHTLADRAGAISSGLAGLPGALDSTSASLGRARALIAPANQLLLDATPAIRQLPGAASELHAALGTAAPVLQRVAGVAALAPGAARSLMPVLRAAAPLLRVMIPALRRMGPMLDQFRVRFPDAFSFFSNWADFTSNYDANGHGARVGIVLPPAPTNALPADSNGAGQLAPPYLRTPGSLEGQPWYDYAKSFVASGRRP
ncbi:MAG: MlaD family protein [Solirubrobacteraceae bacterium]